MFHKKTNQKTSRMTVGGALLFLLLLPLFIYSVFQFFQRNKDEQLIRDIYRQQLDTILFSVNQQLWGDISFAGEFFHNVIARNLNNLSDDHVRIQLFDFFNRQSSLQGVMVFNNKQFPVLLSREQAIARDLTLQSGFDKNQVLQIVKDNETEIERRFSQIETGYQQPLFVEWENWANINMTLVLFPLNVRENTSKKYLGGFILDDEMFIQDVVARHIESINDSNFTIGILHREQDFFVYRTRQDLNPPFDLSEKLWMLPSYDIVIKTSGVSMEDLASERIRINLLFLGIVNLLILIGVIFFFTNFRQKMRLADMKTNFVANVSHELRTPLALIRMYAETLEMGRVREKSKIQSYYEIIIQESNRLSRLIHNILDFSKIESGKKQYQFQEVQITNLVNEVLDMYDFHLKKNEFKVSKEIGDNIPELLLDSAAITQAILNLLENAIKFSLDVKHIHIILQKTSENVILSVKDHGIGIPLSEQQHIFDQFFRSGDSLVHNTKGSGLGLSLVKHIMSVHDGEVIVKSQPGKGSQFNLIFPTQLHNKKSSFAFIQRLKIKRDKK